MQITVDDSRSKLTVAESHFGYYSSPIGLVEVGGASEVITSLNFVEERRDKLGPNFMVEKALRQISEYFLGTRREFDLPIAFQGTDFQQSVWRQLLTIPFGQTLSYQNIAHAIDKPRAVRAVGAANGSNPISIIVPCHRVIGSDGSLTGYGGGLWRKEWLLEHEGILLL
jgi:methylated-DNA-[protein]-cysteine S-methyltransferase